jgi:hypothetical protein
MYMARAFNRALSETINFWSLHRTWAFFGPPVSGILLRWLWKSSRIDVRDGALFAFSGYAFVWIGSFVINLFNAPALLDADRKAEIEDLDGDIPRKSKSCATPWSRALRNACPVVGTSRI